MRYNDLYESRAISFYHELEKFASQQSDLIARLKSLYPDEFSRNVGLADSLEKITTDGSILSWLRSNFGGRGQLETHPLYESVQTLEIYHSVKSGIEGKLKSEEFVNAIFNKPSFKDVSFKREAASIKNIQNLNIDQIQSVIDVFFRGKVSVNIDAVVDEAKERVGKVGEWNIWLPHTKDTSAKIAGYDSVTLEPKTTWCTARTMGSNLFYNYIGRHDYSVFLFYIIKDNPSGDKDWLSIGFAGSVSARQRAKPVPDFSGKDGGLSVDRANKGLVEDDFIAALGRSVWLEIKSLMERKIESLDRKNPAREIIISIAKDKETLVKELSKKSLEEKRDFCEVILNSDPSPDVFDFVANFYAKNFPKDFFGTDRLNPIIERGRKSDGEDHKLLLVALKNLAIKEPKYYNTEKNIKSIVYYAEKITKDISLDNYVESVRSAAEVDPEYYWTSIIHRGRYALDESMNNIATIDLTINALSNLAKKSASLVLYEAGDIRYFFERIKKNPGITPEQLQKVNDLETGYFDVAKRELATEECSLYFTRNLDKDLDNDEFTQIAATKLASYSGLEYFTRNLHKSKFATPETNNIALEQIISKSPWSFFNLGLYKEYPEDIISKAYTSLSNSTPSSFFQIRLKLLKEGFTFPGLDDLVLVDKALDNASKSSHYAAGLITEDLYTNAARDLNLDISDKKSQAVKTLLANPTELFSHSSIYTDPAIWNQIREPAMKYIDSQTPANLLDSVSKPNSIFKFINNSPSQTPEDEDWIIEFNNKFIEKTSALKNFYKAITFIMSSISPHSSPRKSRLDAVGLEGIMLKIGEGFFKKKDFYSYRSVILRGYYGGSSICFGDLPSFQDLNRKFFMQMAEAQPRWYSIDAPIPTIQKPEYRDILIDAFRRAIPSDIGQIEVILEEWKGGSESFGVGRLKWLNDPEINSIVISAATKVLDTYGPKAYLSKPFAIKISPNDSPLLSVRDEAMRRLSQEQTSQDPNQVAPQVISESRWLLDRLNKLSNTLNNLGYESKPIRNIISKTLHKQAIIEDIESSLDSEDLLGELSEDADWLEYASQGQDHREFADWWQANADDIPGNFDSSFQSFKSWYANKLNSDWHGVDKDPHQVISILLHEINPSLAPAPIESAPSTTVSSNIEPGEIPDAVANGSVTTNRSTDISRITPALRVFINELGSVAKRLGAETPHITSAWRSMETTARYIIKNWVSNNKGQAYLRKLYDQDRGGRMADILERYGEDSPESFSRILEVVKTMTQGHSAGKVVDLRMTDRIKDVLDEIDKSNKFSMKIVDETWTAGPHYHVVINGMK